MRYEKGSFITVPNSDVLKGVHPAAQCLFMWLCYHANQDGKCFPSRKRLADLCGVSVDMVDKMMKLLVDKGIIVKETRKDGTKNETNIYAIIIGGVADGIGQVADGIGQGVADGIGSELNPYSLTKSINSKKSDFEKFWSEYPKKENKKKAMEKWMGSNLYLSIDIILEFIRKAKQTDRWKKGFVPHPTTFLNQERWNDELDGYSEKAKSNAEPFLVVSDLRFYSIQEVEEAQRQGKIYPDGGKWHRAQI